MTSDFRPCNDSVDAMELDAVDQVLHSNQPNSMDCSGEGIDNLKRDRFELLSAYLDSEVTAAERRQVEEWLEHDPIVQCMYRRLLHLRQQFCSMPILEECDSKVAAREQLVEQVLARTCHRTRQLLTWGGIASMLVLTSFVSTMRLEPRATLPKMAEAPHHTVTDDAALGNQPTSVALNSPSNNSAVGNEALMIVLNRPVIKIPTASTSLLEPTSEITPRVDVQ